MRRNSPYLGLGLTLIEILVVLLIISIVAGAMILNISPNRNRQVETFANELAETITFAQEQAILEPAVIRVIIHDRIVSFARYEPKDDEEGAWVAMTNRILADQPIPEVMVVHIRVLGTTAQDDSQQNNVPIIISANGDITPFIIYLGWRGEKPRYAIVGEANGQIINKSLQ